jgi:hypothetical protein
MVVKILTAARHLYVKEVLDSASRLSIVLV